MLNAENVHIATAYCENAPTVAGRPQAALEVRLFFPVIYILTANIKVHNLNLNLNLKHKFSV